MKRQPTVGTTLYCSRCGNEGIPIQRKVSKQKPSFHKKWLYCVHCHKKTNHIECRTSEDVQIFLEKFKNGEYQKSTRS